MVIKVKPFSDTKSNPINTLRSSKELYEQGVRIVIGPVFNESSKYLDELKDMTFISLTNKIYGNHLNVISAGINAISQINTINKFRKINNLERSIILVPNTDYKNEINLAIDKSNIKLKEKFYYDTDPTLLTAQIEKLTRYPQRKQNLKDEIKRLENSDDTNKEKKISRLKKRDTLGGINFDSVIIADFDESLKSVTTSLLYTDVSSKRVNYITLNQWFDESILKEKNLISVDTETTSLNPLEANLVGISFCYSPGKACYIPLRHTPENLGAKQVGLDFTETSKNQERVYQQINFNKAMKRLKQLLEDRTVLKVGHNLKYDSHILKQKRNGNIKIFPLDDTMCLSYVLDAGRIERHGLDYLAAKWLSHQTIKYEDVCGRGSKQVSFDKISPSDACNYAAEDADITFRLWMILKPRLANERMTVVYNRLERPLIKVLTEMERNGIVVDASILRRLSNDFASKIVLLEKEIYNLAGQEFNIASPKQLGEILFEKLKLEGGKKSKSGAWSTSADILEELASRDIIIAQKVLDFRQLAKLKSTYTDALQESINSRTGRVHTSYSMVGALTGRLSSSDPNLQNIPIRTTEGRSIRTAFIAEAGSKIISADYSQIELRLVAHVAKEKSMLEAFRNGIDIHAQTAAEVFEVPINKLNGETRRRAKAINFGIIYGISGFGLARQLGISQGEARDYIKAYFTRFPGIRDYMEQMKQLAREKGFVETLFGRRIYISNIKSSNAAVRGFAERQAINAPIQGSAADIIKRAMIKMPNMINKLNLKTKMLLQVHDELIFETPEDEVPIAFEAIKSTMEKAHEPILSLDVPIIVEGGAADSWARAH